MYFNNSVENLKSFSTSGLPILPKRTDAAFDTASISFLNDTLFPLTLIEINPSNARLSNSVPLTFIENILPATDER